MSQVYDAFGSVPSHIAPSIKVRRWDQGLYTGVATFAAVWAGGLYAGLAMPGPELGAYTHHLTGAISAALHYATFGLSMDTQASDYLATIEHPWHAAFRVGVPLVLAGCASAWMTKLALVPKSNTWHLSGPKLLKDKEALQEARRRSLSQKQQEADPLCLAVHPDWVLSKKHWSRHGFIVGGVGSGKTQILLRIIKQIIDRDEKLFLYDAKGDMTAKFRRPIILSPFDARSWVWDVARDVRNPSQAAAFAASLIPEDSGNGKFWTIAAQQLLTGAIRSLQNTKGTTWGWKDLADAVSQGAPEMLPMIQAHYPKAAPLIANAESQSTASVLSTLAGFTRVIDDLALAWPKRSKDRSFAITDWVLDDYKGRKQVIVQAGADAQLTKAYISALINVCVPTIVGPQLTENEEGRCLAFILDELPSLGVINLAPLIDRGRSKGVQVLCGLQDSGQLKATYGDNQAKALLAMVGTHIICQVQAGETREDVARMLGKNKVAWRNHDKNAQVHEESRGVVSANELTDELGYRKGKHMGPLGWGIRAIVFTSGDPLLLNFPGIDLPNKRESQVIPKWMKGPAGSRSTPTPTPEKKKETERVLGLSMDDLQNEMARIYRDD